MNDIQELCGAEETGPTRGQQTMSKACGQLLVSLADRAEIARVLGIAEPEKFNDEFWTIQGYTVIHRFWTYCLHELQLPLTLERTAADMDVLERVMDLAQSKLGAGLSYDQIRNWWLAYGQARFNAEQAARKEREELSRLSTVALLFFEGSRPKYLKVEGFSATTVQSPDEATMFPVLRAEDITKPGLERAAEDFRAIASMLGASSVKILCRKK